MNPTVYLETTIIGYLAMQPSSILRIAANQQATQEWWIDHRHRFSVYVSRFVVSECSAGDSDAAANRLQLLDGVPQLEVTADAESLAAALLADVPLPPKAGTDALHDRSGDRQRHRVSPDLELQAYRQSCSQAADRLDLS